MIRSTVVYCEGYFCNFVQTLKNWNTTTDIYEHNLFLSGITQNGLVLDGLLDIQLVKGCYDIYLPNIDLPDIGLPGKR